MAGFRFTLTLTPHGYLVISEPDDAPELAPELGQRLRTAFSRGAGFGLLQLGAREIGETLPAVFAYWRDFAARFVTSLCARKGADDPSVTAPDPPPAELAELSLSPPEMIGAETVTPDVLHALWQGRGGSICIPRHVYGAPFSAGQDAASAARAGSERICRGRE
jgi:hypothetical protein